jgi:hypothetical protein
MLVSEDRNELMCTHVAALGVAGAVAAAGLGGLLALAWWVVVDDVHPATSAAPQHSAAIAK